MKTYKVKIYEQPIVYEIKAVDKADAEYKAVYKYNGGNYQEISKVKVTIYK